MSDDTEMQTVILCGGKGTRLRELTETLPKALVEVGGRPILWHIMQGFAHRGFQRFVLAAGHLGDRIEDAVRGFDRTWEVHTVDTGPETETGGRIKLLEDHLDGDTFFATYGDGVADIDHRRLLDFHRRHGCIATVTAVRPWLTFGLLNVGHLGGQVTSFDEKPRLDGWINGGFFVFDRRIFSYLSTTSVLEREPMRALVADRQLVAYRHEGYWACMDTYKDTAALNAAWASGEAPWCTWDGPR